MNSLFIFHRDLRKEDNIGLIETIKKSKKVFPVFIFTPDQVSNKNKYKSDNSVQFMVNSLAELEKSFPVSFFYGDTTQIVKKLLNTKSLEITHVAYNKDFTPYAKSRDNKLKKMIKASFKEIDWCEHDDVTLQPLEKTLKGDGTPYRVYTPFYNNAKKIKVPSPLKWSSGYSRK